MSIENPTHAEIRTNHERVTKAVEKLNSKAWNGIRYSAILPEGKPGKIKKETRPYNGTEWTTECVAQTELYDTIGVVIDYKNKYSGKHHGTMTYRIYQKSERIGTLHDYLRTDHNHLDSLKRDLVSLQASIAKAEERIESRKQEIATAAEEDR